MAESLGAARLDIEVDVTQLEAAIRTAKSRLADMSTDAQRQYQQLGTAEKRRIDSLISQADTLGLTRGQQLAYNAALKTSGPVLDEITRKIARNEASLRASGTQLNAYGMSAKQSAQALRQVPAQLTDIVVGLSSGQRPLMVLLQQGGQLKDLFGGIGPAAKALGGSLLGLVNPYTLLAGSVGALGMAYAQAQRESFEFEKSIILFGNAAGLTSGQMQDMAARIDQVAGTQRNASKVIAELSATGKVGADALETVAVAAIQLQRIGGVAIDDTIRSFVALGEKPAEASRKLNQQYGYLTDAALKRIEIVEREGRATEAATLAQKLFADAAISRTDELAQHLDGVTISARGAKDAVAEVWDGVLDLFRSDNTPNGLQQRLDQARKSLANSSWLDDFNGANNRRREVIADLERQLAVFENIDRIEAKRAARLAGNAAQKAADAQWDRIREANLTKEERLQKEIAAIKAAGLAAKRGEAEIERQIAAARQRFENPAKTKAPKVNAEDSSAKSLMDAVQRQIEANQLLAATGERVSATESLAIRIRQALADKTNGMSEANRALLQSMLPALEASGAAAASAQAEAKAKEELTRRNATLAAQSERLREEAEQQRQRAIMMADPMHGARAALEDYLAMAQNVSEQTYDLLTNSLKGGEDAFVRLATTGKLSFHNLANSIIADIARIAARQAIINPLLGLFGGGGGGLAKSIGFAPVGGTMVAAKGAAFSGGLQTFAAGGAFTNQIVSTPTLFPFAKGTGLMGEAGPEAIMPLKRTQGGQLGVIASGGAGELQVHINNSGGAKVSARQQTSKGPDGQQMRRLLIDVVAEDVASGGGVAAAIRGRFGVAERV